MRNLTLLLIVLTGGSAFAEERSWSLDHLKDPELTVRGEVVPAPGVRKTSLLFDGSSILEIENSSSLTHQETGSTFSIWVNPYSSKEGQQMILGKNRYSLNEREWGVMIDKDGLYTLYVRQDGWQTLKSEVSPSLGSWQHVAFSISGKAATLWIDGQSAGTLELERPVSQTKAPVTLGGVNDNGRIWQNLVGALDELTLSHRVIDQKGIVELYERDRVAAKDAEKHKLPKKEIFPLWSGAELPANPEDLPFAEGIEHRTLLDARDHDYKFLHGAAIIHHEGTFFVNWANSPKNENQEFETLQGRRSSDGGRTWSKVEMIAPGFEGEERHSHGVYLKHQGRLWTFAARFGKGTPGRKFAGLSAEAFVLDEDTDQWVSKGVAMENCWPYDEPVRMGNGNFITGGQDKDGLPVVAISHGDDVLRWDSVLIPYGSGLKPSFAETTVTSHGDRMIAVIRGGGGAAWVSTSEDFGRTWTQAVSSNLPMPRAKAYLGRLSTGQLYLLSNYGNRDTLVVSVGKPGEETLSSMYRLRHGKSEPPRFEGFAKSKQWSYPYGYEHDGKLYVVYSIGKEDCGLTTIPISALAP